MKINYVYIGKYREQEEGGIPPAGGGNKGAEGAAPQETPPEDHGNDTVPDEISPWDALNKDFETDDSDDDEFALDIPEEIPPVVPEEITPVEPEAVEVSNDPEEIPTETPAPTPPEEQPTEDVKPQVPETTPAPTNEEIEVQRKQMLDGLEKQFQLSEEESLQMVTDPAKVMPKLMARQFADMYESVMGSLRQHLPAAIQHNIQTTKAQASKADQFFTAWPKLDRVAHGADIANVSQMYSQLNPGATEEQVIQNVGLQVMLHHGITPEALAPQANAPVPPAPPRQPASVHGGSLTPQQSGNEWASMADELLVDDSDF